MKEYLHLVIVLVFLKIPTCFVHNLSGDSHHLQNVGNAFDLRLDACFSLAALLRLRLLMSHPLGDCPTNIEWCH